MKAESYICEALSLRGQIHIYHRQTESFAEHKALDAFYNEIVEQIDEFVETYQGRFGRIKLEKNTSSLENYTKGAPTKALKAFLKSTEAMMEEVAEKAPELENLLQETLALTNKTLYMLTLA